MSAIPFTFIVIPCYNEEKGISFIEYSTFLDNFHDTMICFVNDGSKDDTLPVLNTIREKHHNQVHIVSLMKNSGKAEAVRTATNTTSFSRKQL
jgi:dolichyl-phosphate beta-glucosyltransferase